MILLIDNYDPAMREFYKYASDICGDINVIRNDEMSADDICALSPDAVIIGSGCGNVSDTGICISIIDILPEKTPVLGIGLGAEIIANYLGASFVNSGNTGKNVFNTGFDRSCSIFKNMPEFAECRADILKSLSSFCLSENVLVTARDEYGRNIAFCSRNRNMFGICPYPIFFGDEGKNIIRSFVSIIGE